MMTVRADMMIERTVKEHIGVFYRLSGALGTAYERTGWIWLDTLGYRAYQLSQIDADAVFALVMLMATMAFVGFVLGLYSTIGADGILDIVKAFTGRVRGIYEATRAYIGL